ncbi:hypothetical protein BH23ACT10_BH23ACT10_16310 [soil metagenome]
MSGRRRVPIAALALVVLSLAAAAVDTWLPTGDDLALITLPFVLVGALLMVRRPGNRIGWVLGAIGFLAGTGSTAAAVALSVASAGRPVPTGVVALAWYGEWYWVPFLFLMLVAMPLLLPSGEVTSPRARAVGRIAVATCAAFTASAMFQGELLAERLATPLSNPVGFLPYGDVDLSPVVSVLVASVATLGAVAVGMLAGRLSRSAGVERQQAKVVVFGVMVAVGAFLGNIVLEVVGVSLPAWLESVMIAVIPWTILLAVTRYRLYEIDRIIGRTVGYLLVSAVLIGVYAVVAIVPSALLNIESDLLVAAATLAAVGVFVPVRRRVQDAVDRRFNRARYDAALVVESFGSRLRDDLDYDSLTADLRDVVTTTVQPAHVSLWITRRSGGR